MRKKWGIHLKALILLLDEILIGSVIIFVLWELGVPIPFWVYILAGLVCATVYWLLYRILSRQDKKSPAGYGSMIGLRGKSITSLNPQGLVRVQGEMWKAVSKCGVVGEGVDVVIEDLQNLTLIVTIQGESE
jgi:membrane-bound ClpP family serine protease